MEFSVKKYTSQIVVIQCIGQLWEANDLIEFKNSIESFVDGDINRCLLDFSRLTFINSHALGVIVTLYKSFTQKNIELIITYPIACIKELLEISGFNQFIRIVEDEVKLSELLK